MLHYKLDARVSVGLVEGWEKIELAHEEEDAGSVVIQIAESPLPKP